MCEYQSLYYSDDGYVVRCPECGFYQLAFGNTMLNLTEKDYRKLYKVVQEKYEETDYFNNERTRSVVIPTPSRGQYVLLTKYEANRLYDILEEADSEEKIQGMMDLFKQ